MNKKFIILIIIFTFLITGCSNNNLNNVNQTSTTIKEPLSCDEIRKEARKITSSMNYCESDSECLIIKDYPLGCYYLMNKNADQTNIENIIKEYNDSNCPNIILDCYNNILTTSCHNNKCEINR